jgi:hypothetical protein
MRIQLYFHIISTIISHKYERNKSAPLWLYSYIGSLYIAASCSVVQWSEADMYSIHMRQKSKDLIV